MRLQNEEQGASMLPKLSGKIVWFILLFFFFIWVLRPVKIISESVILSRVDQMGRKREIPEKNHLTIRRQSLVCFTCDPSQARTHSGEMTSDLER